MRTVLVIGPEKKIKLMGLPDDHGLELRRDPARGRFDATHRQVSTPVNWKHGDDVIIAGSVNDDDAKKLFPECWRSPKPYIRIVKQPA